MDADSALVAISNDGRRLLEAAVALDEVVPTCPDWSVHDLLGHIGWVHHYVAAHVAQRATERVPPEDVEAAPRGEAVREYAESGLAAVLEALGSVDPALPMWTWSDRQEAGFFIRRMVHETAVHRYDAESAIGQTSGVDDDQGADGVDGAVPRRHGVRIATFAPASSDGIAAPASHRRRRGRMDAPLRW